MKITIYLNDFDEQEQITIEQSGHDHSIETHGCMIHKQQVTSILETTLHEYVSMYEIIGCEPKWDKNGLWRFVKLVEAKINDV